MVGGDRGAGVKKMTEACEEKKAEFAINFERMPVKLVNRGSATAGGNMVVIGLLVGALSAMGAAALLRSGPFGLLPAALLVAAAGSAVLLAVGAHYLTRRITTIISAEGVSRQTRSCYGKQVWEEPLSGYRGVGSHIRQRPAEDKTAEPITTWTVWLEHSDGEKRILLYEAGSDAGVADYAATTAEQLKLAVLVEAEPEVERGVG